MDEKKLEQLARLICELDVHSPEPDADIKVGIWTKKAWEPRAEIIKNTMEMGLFCWPPKVELVEKKKLTKN